MRKTKNLRELQIDGVLCISLKDRHDRRELLLNEFKDSGLAIEFVIVEHDKENPERGCFYSHIRCAEIALSRGLRSVLILEDDATLRNFQLKQITRINQFISEKNPELFYLGATLGKVWLTWHLGVARFRAKGAFAYILSENGCRKILEYSPFSGRAIDKIHSKEFKAFGSFPMICEHQPESLAKSNIFHFRSQDGTAPDAEFWRKNRKLQYTQVIKNFGKTLIRKGF